MTEWWTYRPSDFLMFSARAYGRLVELYNGAMWPLHVPVLLAGVWLLWATARHHRHAASAGALLLAIAWAGVGWAFLWQRFAQINTAAAYLGVAFGVQAGLLALAALWLRPADTGATRALHRAGCALLVAAVVAYPAWPLLAGAAPAQAEVAGLMPQPTALATLGWLLAMAGRHRHWLAVIPLGVLVVGATTSWLLHGG